MGAGKYRHRVEIQWDRGTTQDASGWPTADQKTSAWRWGEVLDLSGLELIRAQALHAEAKVQFTTRYMEGLTPAHRIKFGSRVLAIHHVSNPDARKRETVCLCSEAR